MTAVKVQQQTLCFSEMITKLERTQKTILQKQEGPWALGHSPSSFSIGEDVNYKIEIPFFQDLSPSWVTVRS